ncbi:hypothetical protein BLL42_27460 (plasmid) [Pseudomonas frederiksbergensis]|uniref:Uncharacterized protein n=1 Tax=Pseudomonas frederiksbergensis TaxID=104087 RepID=A0A1J0EU17_9PSED|nr:hypothetical protein [Pseudomonas frederiksbergensis]APC19475.1 hypothetical protein BLL42_27460 [Pseudomonas frederiksbergensis]
MKVNPLFALSAPAVIIGAFVLWRVFHHDVSDLAAVDAQPPGKYFLLLKETGSGQHDAAIVVKSADGKQTILPGVAKGDINSPVGNQRLITYSPTSKGCEGIVIELLQFGGSVKAMGLGRIDPGCALNQELTEGTVLKKL